MLTQNSGRWIFLLEISRFHAAARLLADSPQTPPEKYYGLYAGLQPSMSIVLAALICILFVIGFISIYIRLRDEAESRTVHEGSCDRSRRNGLDPSVVAAFPAFACSVGDMKIVRGGGGDGECAICLSEFVGGEEEKKLMLRLLPTCGHVFHADCIDAWFEQHVTCPVCRATLAVTTASSSMHGSRDTVKRKFD